MWQKTLSLSSTIITLLSGLGTRDPSLSVAKATLIRYAPDAAIVDLVHDVTSHDLQQAAYILRSAYSHFPKGTIHIVPVDVFAGEQPRILLAEKDGHYFIVPDNGIIPLVFPDDVISARLCYEYSGSYAFYNWLHDAGSIVASILGHNTSAYAAYTIKSVTRLVQPRVMHDSIDCNVLFVDRYENVVLDITKAQFESIVGDKSFRIRLMRVGDITAVSNNYNDVPHGKPLCRFNNADFLELAVNHAKAASLLGLNTRNTASIRYHVVKIFLNTGSASAMNSAQKLQENAKIR